MSWPSLTHQIRRNLLAVAGFYADREYFRRLYQIALPIALQNFVMASLAMVGTILIGQLGEAAVAAVGLANQVFFLLSLFLFGVTSGSAMFTAQLWGKRDIANIRKVLGLCLTLAVAGSAVFSILSIGFPAVILRIYTTDPAVISLGSSYLRIYGWAYVLTAISFSYAAVLRSTGNVQVPLAVSITALLFNTALSYLLIFGKLGLPALGVEGAALAVTLARVLELALMVGITYARKLPAAAPLREMFSFDLTFVRRVIKPVLPVAANELIWSLGITTYNVIYAHIGTASIAAMNIVATIDSLGFVIFIAIANASAILVGQIIGTGDNDLAYRYAARSLSLSMLGAVLVGLLILSGSGFILAFYKVSPEVIENARRVLTIMSLVLWLRVSNLILFIGIFRSGGDTRFGLVLDAGTIWVVGVPLAFLGAFVFNLPVYGVYLLITADELVKWLVGLQRFFSKKWIHNLTQQL